MDQQERASPSRRDPRSLANDPTESVASASLASLFALRKKFLPDLVPDVPSSAAELNELISLHRREWIDAAFPQGRLPQKLLLSNIAAFAVHALEKAGLPQTEEDMLMVDWFGNPSSMLFGHIHRRNA